MILTIFDIVHIDYLHHWSIIFEWFLAQIKGIVLDHWPIQSSNSESQILRMLISPSKIASISTFVRFDHAIQCKRSWSIQFAILFFFSEIEIETKYLWNPHLIDIKIHVTYFLQWTFHTFQLILKYSIFAKSLSKTPKKGWIVLQMHRTIFHNLLPMLLQIDRMQSRKSTRMRWQNRRRKFSH